jgi:hypothetical protein
MNKIVFEKRKFTLNTKKANFIYIYSFLVKKNCRYLKNFLNIALINQTFISLA